MNGHTKYPGAHGKATVNPRQDVPKGIDDERNVEQRARDRARRVGTGDDAAKKVQPCIDSENGSECNDEPCSG